jgi:hypothetical protein
MSVGRARQDWHSSRKRLQTTLVASPRNQILTSDQSSDTHARDLNGLGRFHVRLVSEKSPSAGVGERPLLTRNRAGQYFSRQHGHCRRRLSRDLAPCDPASSPGTASVARSKSYTRRSCRPRSWPVRRPPPRPGSPRGSSAIGETSTRCADSPRIHHHHRSALAGQAAERLSQLRESSGRDLTKNSRPGNGHAISE